MGLEDKGRNVVIHHLGGAKEQSGRLTGNGQLQREGVVEQVRTRFGKAAGDPAAETALPYQPESPQKPM